LDVLNIEAENRLSMRNRTMGLRAVDLEREAAAGVISTRLDAEAAAFGLASDATSKAAILERANAMIDQGAEEGDISESARASLTAEFAQKSAQAHVRHLINTNPAGAINALNDPNDSIVKSLDPVAREQLKASAEVELRRLGTASERAEAARFEAQLNSVIDRIYNPANPQGAPTISELRDMDLGPKAFEHFSKIIIKQAEGEDTNKVIPSVVNDLYARVWDGRITDPKELVTYLGHGIDTTELGKLQADVADRQKDPLSASDGRLVAEYFRATGPLIEHSVFGQLLDPVGATKKFEHRLQVERLIREGKENGLSIAGDLLEKNSPHFVGKILPSFRRTRQQIMQDVRTASEISRGTEKTESLFFVPDAAGKERLPGESGDDWFKRINK